MVTLKKILYCASTLSHIQNFHIPYLQAFHDKGYEVWVAANQSAPVPYADRIVALPFDKKFFSVKNVKAIFQVRKLLKNEKFDTVSTHTALASAVVRAAVFLLHQRPKVFCTVHGYLFNEGDGLKKWAYLLPEKICARVTDILMVMNHEDYEIAKRHKLYKDKLYYINGMGIDLTKYKPVSREERLSARREKGMSEGDFLFVYAAEFSRRKNQAFLIKAFANICKDYPRMKLLLAGEGALQEECKELVRRLHAEDQIQFLGYVTDIRELYSVCDVCVTSSKIEGLPFNVMEALACGLPVIASDIKGHRELVKDGVNGSLFQTDTQLEDKLIYSYNAENQQNDIWQNGIVGASAYSVEEVKNKIKDIYEDFV